MSMFGGTYTKHDKKDPGVYNRSLIIGSPSVGDVSGTVAFAMPMDWGKRVNVITASDFSQNAETLTGYSYNAPENAKLREVFKNAGTAIVARLGGGTQANGGEVGMARDEGAAGNNIVVSVMNNINNENYFDVDTYYMRRLIDSQTVAGVPVKKAVLTETQVTDGAKIDGMTVNSEIKDNQVIITYTGLPEDAKVSVQLKLGTVITALQPGRIDKEEGEGNITLTFGPEAPYKAPYTLLFRVTEKGQSIQTVKTIEFTMEVKEAEEMAGADGSKLTDNEFVTFSNGVIPAHSGYVFTGGETDTTLTVGDYVDALNYLDGKLFNYLICDSTDPAVKELYTEFTRRNREDNGLYFQVVNYRGDDDYEAVIKVYNDVLDGAEPNAVFWTGGAMAGIDLSEELTNTRYTGELRINTSLTQARIRQLDAEGYFLFHEFGEDQVRTYVDINSLTTYTEEKEEAARNNQVIRVVDGLYNRLNTALNDSYVGKTKNNPLGRAKIWSICEDVVNDFVTSGAIEPLEDKTEQITVKPVEGDPYAMEVLINVVIAATGRKIYLGVSVTHQQITE